MPYTSRFVIAILLCLIVAIGANRVALVQCMLYPDAPHMQNLPTPVPLGVHVFFYAGAYVKCVCVH